MAGTQPKSRGVWEPVNYAEDLWLNDVFFVSADVGWATGVGGTILNTRDAGKTWAAQLGGDPQSREPAIDHLQFVDGTHGWALQAGAPGGYKVLRTTDGESWEQVGSIKIPRALIGFAFSSATNGVFVDQYDGISQTTDGGRTWKRTFAGSQCRTKAEVAGLMRDLACTIHTVTMASPTVGYAFGGFDGSAPDLLLVLKTEDGGATWKLSTTTGVGDVVMAFPWQVAFFLDENTGVLNINGRNIYATADGAQTWRGLVGTAGADIRFADPAVGWSFRGNELTYTTDGGKRWASRPIAFPAKVNAFSLPRRDRAYVVGDHGMVYRYRVVPAAEIVAKAIDAPAMPLIETALEEQVGTMQTEINLLQREIQAAASKPAGGAADAGTGGVLDSCCGADLKTLEATVDAFAGEVPVFTTKFRNLNLILGGIRTVADLFGHAQGLKDSIKTLRQSRDLASAAKQLTELSRQVSAAASVTTSAVQKQR